MRNITIGALGRVIDVELGAEVDPDLEARLAELWRDAPATEKPDGGNHGVVRVGFPDDEEALDASDPRRLASELSSAVTLAAIRASRGRGLLFHAAGVADDDGRVVVFVAASGGGKTTLSSALGRHFGYVSDETVLIESSLAVHSYRKPLSIVQEDRGPKEQVRPQALGLRELPDAPLTLAGIVLLDRRADAPPNYTLTEVALGDAVLELTQQLSFAAADRRTLERLATAASGVGGVLRLSYRDDTDLRPAVREVIARSRSVEPEWEIDQPSSAGEPGPGEWSRHNDAAGLWDGGRLLVWTPGRIHEVAGMGELVWDVLGEGSLTTERLAEILEDEIGPPPTGNTMDAILPALTELVDAGILTHGE